MAGLIITLTTDFGTRDGYVAAIKGYLMGKLAWLDTRIVDVTHDIPRGDIAHAAWIVGSALKQFPEESIHYVVVDPGAFRGVGILCDGRVYVGPDNGTFATLQADRANELNLAIPIFNGRERFAPAIADLVRRGPAALATCGPPIRELMQLPWGPRTRGEGRVIHVDQFGNAITDLPVEECDGPGVRVAGTYIPRADDYSDVPPGGLLANVGNEGTIELAVNGGNACKQLGIARGAIVVPAEPGGVYR